MTGVASLTLEQARRHWGATVPSGLRDHLERVSRQAAELANRWGHDPEEAALAGYLHDVARARPPAMLLEQARALGLAVDAVCEAVPVLLHGAVGMAEVVQAYGEQDPSLTAAVRHHSTGREAMTMLEKIVFLADKLDPRKEGRDPFLEDLRDRAFQDLDGAVILYLDREIRHLLDRGGVIHPAALEARNGLLMRRAAEDRGPV